MSRDKLDQILQLRRVLSRGKVRESGSVAQGGREEQGGQGGQGGQEEQEAQGGQGGQGLEPKSTHNTVGWKSGLADKKGKRCFLPYIYICTALSTLPGWNWKVVGRFRFSWKIDSDVDVVV